MINVYIYVSDEGRVTGYSDSEQTGTIGIYVRSLKNFKKKFMDYKFENEELTYEKIEVEELSEFDKLSQKVSELENKLEEDTVK